MRATIATIADRERVGEDTARHWPSSSCDMRAMSALTSAIRCLPDDCCARERPGLSRTLRGRRGASNGTMVPAAPTPAGLQADPVPRNNKAADSVGGLACLVG